MIALETSVLDGLGEVERTLDRPTPVELYLEVQSVDDLGSDSGRILAPRIVRRHE